jgi:transcriptional regulator with XRE-family HTH domain
MPGTRKQYVAPIDEKTIGKRLKELRLHRGMTQAEVAKELGINQSAVSDYESGQVRLHAALVAAFARVLRVPTDQILGIEKTTPNGHVKDRRFIRRLEKVDRLSKRDRQTLLGTIDAFLTKLPE